MNKDFSKRYFLSELIAIGFGFPVAAGYVLLLLNIDFANVIRIGIFSSCVAGFVELFLATPMNALLSRKARAGVKDWDAGLIKDNARKAELYHELIKLPFRTGVMFFGRIAGGALICIIYMLAIKIDPVLCLMSVILSGYGAYLAGVLAFASLNRLVAPVTQEIVASGALSAETINRHKHFSLSVRKKIVLYLLVPVLVTNFSVFCSVYSTATVSPDRPQDHQVIESGQTIMAGSSYAQVELNQTVYVNYNSLLYRILGDILVSVVTLIAFMLLSLRMNTLPLKELKKSLEGLVSGEGNFTDRIPTDLGDDFAHVSWLMNQALDSFYDVITKIRSASKNLNISIQDLNVASQEISATSNQQAAGVKEIISTMEDSDQLSKRVATQAIEVAKIAEGTKDVVNTGFGILRQTLDKMDAIKDANTTSIQGIKHLGDKIANIWDIVNMINSIADQTKIIAFNAELEAASAGDAGRNFQIVATEIRRLADSTVNSTSEIKARINEIQNSSDHLIISSEEGTAKIIAGWELSSRLRTLFEDIQSTSEISAESAHQIANSIGQQVSAFDQILMTLKQISAGIDNFVTSTASTSKLTKVLMDMSAELHRVAEKYELQKDGAAQHG